MIPFRLVLTATLLAAASSAPAADSCSGCHADKGFKVQNPKLYGYYQEWHGSVHDLAGVSCADCHGGDREAEGREAAHRGVVHPSGAASPLNFARVPDTCGACHMPVKEHFVKSKHYKLLMDSGKAPNCVTCHGSMNSKTDYKAIVTEACSDCHNEKTGNHPEIVGQAKVIMQRLSYAEGYRKWAEFYYDSTGQRGKMKKIDPLVKAIARDWHEFNFADLDRKTEELVAELKSLFDRLRQEREKAQQPAE